MIIHPKDNIRKGKTIQRIEDPVSGRPIYACMYVDGQVQLYKANITDRNSGTTHLEGELIIKDDEDNIIQHRKAFGVVIENGAFFKDGVFTIYDQEVLDLYWNELAAEAEKRGLIMPVEI